MEASELVALAKEIYRLKEADIFLWGIDLPTFIQTILAASALAYAFVTYKLLRQGREQLKNAEKQLDYMKEERRLRFMPILTFRHSQNEKTSIFIIGIKNITSNPAIDICYISISCDRENKIKMAIAPKLISISGNDEFILSHNFRKNEEVEEFIRKIYGDNALQYIKKACKDVTYWKNEKNDINIAFYFNIERHLYVVQRSDYYDEVFYLPPEGTSVLYPEKHIPL